MTLKGFARHMLAVAAACWMSAPISAHVLNVGTIDQTLEHAPSESLEMPDEIAPNEGMTAHGLAPNVSLAHPQGAPILPWERHTVYTVAGVLPGFDGAAFGGKVRTLYHDVIDISGAPAAEPWLAALLALGLIAVQLRRTQRLLHHRPMAR